MQSAALACLFLASAAALQLSSPPQLRPLRTRPIRLQADEPETDAKTDEEGAALAAAFKARLDEEGGETAFRLKSDANNLAESAKETASAAGSKIANLLDVGGRRAGPGMMDPGSWNLTGRLLRRADRRLGRWSGRQPAAVGRQRPVHLQQRRVRRHRQIHLGRAAARVWLPILNQPDRIAWFL